MGDSMLPLESVIGTEELERRGTRPPDYEAENRALASLMQELVSSSSKVLQKLADTALTLCRAHSAGISLLQEQDRRQVFVWPALAGESSRSLGRKMPRECSPCGLVLDHNAPLLLLHPARYFPLSVDALPIAEMLLVPFHVAGKPIGTLWILAHDETRRFDKEDLRLLTSLSTFVSTAYQVLTAQEREARASADKTEELAATRRLQDISTRLIREGDVNALYHQILDAAADLMHSDMASLQMLYPTRGELRLIASKGFAASSAAFWEWVHAGSGSTCGEALRTARRVIVSDVEACDFIVGTRDLEEYRASDIRAVQSTPLISRSGQALGMLSTHWREPHQPSERELRLLDVLARQAADLIERAQTEARLRDSETRAKRVLESITDSLLVLDADWRVTYMNAATRRTLVARGMQPDDVIGKHFWNEVFPHARGTRIEREYKLAMSERVAVEFDYLYEPWQRWYAIRAYPVEEGGIAIYFQDVTERWQTEEALRDSEGRFRVMADSSPIVIWVTDNRGAIEFVNRAYLEFFGVRQEQIQGPGGWQPLLHPDDVEEYAARYFAALRERKPFIAEARVRHADGSWRWIASHGVPRFSVSGEFLGHVGSSPDITEHKRAQEALAESARLKDALYQFADRLQHTKLLNDVYQAALQAIVGALQCDRASILLFDDTGVMRFVGSHGLSEAYRNAVEGHSPWKPEQKDPEPVCISDVNTADLGDSLKATVRAEGIGALSFIPLVSNGKLIGKFMTYYDAPHVYTPEEVELGTTVARQLAFAIERKRAEELLQHNAKQLALITDAAPVFIAYCDTQARFKFVNKPYAARFGLKPEDCIGKRISEIVGEDAYEFFREYVARVLRGEPIRFEIGVQYAGIGERFVHCSYAPELDAYGNVVGFVAAITDITERKRIEEALRQSEERLRETDRRKDEFLATLAHELRNPLAPLHNALQVMKLKGDDAPTVERCRSMMERQLGHMVRLVDDLLDVSRISRGKVELRKERAELATIVQQAVETNRPLLEASGQNFFMDMPAERIVVEADVARLVQIIGNLLNNACKFTHEGGHIWLTVERDGEEAVIRVRDTGVGIAADEFGRIFEMFTQLDTSLERTQSGLGIGLTLVKTLTEMHGGTVEVYSEGTGFGSEFIVRLPTPAAHEEAPRPAPAASAAATTTSLRVLVVDDNIDSADSLAALLELAGHETQVTNDGLEAIRAAAAFKPDLILLDIGLPKLNGYEVARWIRQQPWGQSVTLVALTGWGQDSDRQKSKDVGFDSHLVKPVDYSTLEKLVAGFARSYREPGTSQPRNSAVIP